MQPDVLIGSSEPIQRLRNLIRRVARSVAPVLITGEGGTGKELVAIAIHNSGRRKDKPFVPVNCAAFTETLLENELFGVEGEKIPGAKAHPGKFEQADSGTLFLDVIGNMPLPVQAKILRVLEEREFERVGGKEKVRTDVRVISVTHRNLEEMVEKGTFREDLFYRINALHLAVPPLRERELDVLELAEHFLARANATEKRHVKLSDRAMELLKAYSWPGNVRELSHAIEGAVVVCEGDVVLPEHLPLEVTSKKLQPTRQVSLLDAVESLERNLVMEAMKRRRSTEGEKPR